MVIGMVIRVMVRMIVVMILQNKEAAGRDKMAAERARSIEEQR